MKYNFRLLLCSSLIASAGFCQESERPAGEAADRRAALLKRFPESDTNKDGVLSARELAAHLQKQRSGPEGKERLKQMLKRFPKADANKDGKLSWQEARDYQVAKANNRSPQTRRNRAPKVVAPVPDVAYGDHPLQRFDLWPVPEAKGPTPLVIFIHGGGFRGGDKSLIRRETIDKFLDAGVAVAAMNYRLSDSGPYPIMMHDAALGLQTIRHRADQWNIDPQRVVCFGGSAGAGISLWLAFHDDLAEPNSDDPVARQSTRIVAAGAMNGQPAYDIHLFREWFGLPDLQPGPALPAFVGIEDESEFDKPEIRALMKDASPISHLSEDDTAAVYMFYSRPNVPVTLETESSVWVHHVRLGLEMQKAMEPLGLQCIVTAPDIKADNPYDSLEAFLIAKALGASGQ
ncbi:alpha/beta hydrolase fold domain-containing protein [Rosistilla oblonga]|uniref:alpha/beta hydrolase fold domain-containing protein n=1 Tax=Rosistilla oblonga TaxID=2527990 RepID=UPI003A97BD97